MIPDKSNRQRKFYIPTNNGFVTLPMLAFVMLLSAWSYYQLEPTEPYPLVYPANFGNRINIPEDNQTTRQGVYLGRMLFYEKKLSANNTISCASCHQQAKAFTDGKAFSVGVDHVPTARNSMSLANLLWTRKFFWDGRVTGLEAQAAVPLTNVHEMGQGLPESVTKLREDKLYPDLFKKAFGDDDIDGERILKAIAQFERTLISANSKYDQYLRNEYEPTPQELNGMVLFNQAPQPAKGIRGANCSRCHGGVKTYSELFHNNGLDSIPKDKGIEILTGLSTDRGRFKVPTLRNIALTAPYMHDGRFRTLQEVVSHYSEHVTESAALSTFMRGESNELNTNSLRLRADEKRDIIAFLNMLTDNTFVTDTRFADPHQPSATAKK